jgi:D-glycero-alpha-D-manno-heptose-7-phosphate kinase
MLGTAATFSRQGEYTVIISRTPHRISFFGGGTDYPAWYLQQGGKVLGVAIDKYCYITCRRLPPFFNHKHRIVYSKIENVVRIDEIVHPSVRETMRYMGIEEGLEIHHDGDLPARSGMGSSSAFTVGLLKALYALDGKIISRRDLFQKAILIEQELIRENVGSQDQVWAAIGGLNTIEFQQNGEIVAHPIIMDADRLAIFENSFMLFFTGISRFASEVVKKQIQNIPERTEELKNIQLMVDEAEQILTAGGDDFTDFGRLLNETWRIKKTLSEEITNPEIDDMYETALKNGAIGGKLLGAGGGGFMVFYVNPENRDRLEKALDNYIHIPFKFDFSGSEIIVYRPEHYCNNRQ